MHIDDDPLCPNIDEDPVREVLEELMGLLAPLDARLGFAQRVSEICMILDLEFMLTDSPLSNLTGIRDIIGLTYDEIDDRLKEIDADYQKTFSS